MAAVTLRVRHRGGTLRVSVLASDKGAISNKDLYEHVRKALADNRVVSDSALALASDPHCRQLIPSTGTTEAVTNGFFVFVCQTQNVSVAEPGEQGDGDPVDAQLARLDGRVGRGHDALLCRHGLHGMCEHCRPLEPWEAANAGKDGAAAAARPKHLSMHAWLRKQPRGTTLPVPEYSVRRRYRRFCRHTHRPYPHELCSKCQPPAISLQRQPFRLTDHVEFGPMMHGAIDSFLQRWRRTGWQQCAWLLGRYAPYTSAPTVPLGVKAAVLGLLVPPQDNAADGFRLLPYDGDGATAAGPSWQGDLAAIDHTLGALYGLQVVGVLYTDLHAPQGQSGNGGGAVEYRRGPHSFFLAGSELLWMADMQNARPYNKRALNAEESVLPSRWVTVVLTGNEHGQIDVFCYQCSLQAQAMRAANLLSVSTDAGMLLLCPDEDYGKEADADQGGADANQNNGSDERCCQRTPAEAIPMPSIIYGQDNEYGVKVQRCDDRHVPGDYLIVNLSHGFASASNCSEADMTSVDKRLLLADKDLGETIEALMHWRQGLGGAKLEEDVIRPLLQDPSLSIDLVGQHIEVMLKARRSGTGDLVSSGGEQDDGDGWPCAHCTFINSGGSAQDCVMCGLPR